MNQIKHLKDKYIQFTRYELIVACEPLELKFYLWLKMWAIKKSTAFPSFTTICNDLKISRPTLNKLIKDMEASGRLTVEKNPRKNNIYDITWYDKLNDSGRESKTPSKETLPASKETLPEVVKKLYSNELINNELGINNTTEQSSEAKDINLVIDSFKEINQSYQKWFARPPMRAAAGRLVERHGLDRLMKVIMILPKTNTQPYFPTITTPLELEDRWAKLEAAIKKKKNEQLQTGKGIA